MIHVGNCPRVAAKVTVLCVCVTLKNLVLHVSILAVISDNDADDGNRGLKELQVHRRVCPATCSDEHTDMKENPLPRL